MSTYIYDENGEASLRILGKGLLVNLNGDHIGFFDDDSVYDYNGMHRGWFERGVLRDHDGQVVGFVQGADDPPHPLFPMLQLAPLPALPSLAPLKPLKSLKPLKPLKAYAWSELDPILLFEL
jgi:hypothetical protein